MSHVPGWAENWRKTRELKQVQPVSSTCEALPPVLTCLAGDYTVTPADAADETFKSTLAEAFEHHRLTGHPVTVVSTRVFTVSRPGE